MRGEAVGGGRAEAENPKPLSELGSAEALVWQRGGLVLEYCGKTRGYCCVVRFRISGCEVGGQKLDFFHRAT